MPSNAITDSKKRHSFVAPLFTVRLMLLVLVAFSSSVHADRPPSIYLEGKSDAGVILLHGHGARPMGTWSAH